MQSSCLVDYYSWQFVCVLAIAFVSDGFFVTQFDPKGNYVFLSQKKISIEDSVECLLQSCQIYIAIPLNFGLDTFVCECGFSLKKLMKYQYLEYPYVDWKTQNCDISVYTEEWFEFLKTGWFSVENIGLDKNLVELLSHEW